MVRVVETVPMEVEEVIQEVPMMDEEDDNNEKSQKMQMDKPAISKSWTEKSSHAPSYSGGKVTLCHTRGARHLYGYDDDAAKEENNNTLIPFLLAPCSGDLTVIDAIHGIKARTIREGCDVLAGGNSGEDEDDGDMGESVDSDAIVSYALAPNDCDLITASRNNILRHYDISGSPSHSYTGSDGRGPAKVRKVLGRSGHDLPINHVEFHRSGIFFATGSVDGNVKVWDLRGGYATHSFRFHAPGYSSVSSHRGGLRGSITCLQWCPDVTKLWLGVGRDDGSVRVHDLRISKEEEEETLVEMTDHVGPVTCMVWASSSGRSNEFDTFFTASRDEVVNTWSISEEERVKKTTKKKRRKKVSEGKNYSKVSTAWMYYY